MLYSSIGPGILAAGGFGRKAAEPAQFAFQLTVVVDTYHSL